MVRYILLYFSEDVRWDAIKYHSEEDLSYSEVPEPGFLRNICYLYYKPAEYRLQVLFSIPQLALLLKEDVISDSLYFLQYPAYINK